MNRKLKVRRGVTLLEVLFSVLIGTIGLLGAIALLPVASEQARKGRQADAQAIAGESFVNEFMMRRLFDPDNWLAHNGSDFVLAFDREWYYSNASKAAPAAWGSPPTAPVLKIPIPNPDNLRLDSICIDPRATSLYTQSFPAFRFFPYQSNPSAVPNTWPRMHRVGVPRFDPTYSTTNPKTQMQKTFRGYLFDDADTSLADLVGTCSDDLIVEKLEGDRAIPARQMYNPAVAMAPNKLTRESEGRLSWIATLCPTANQDDEFILSMVVFYNRPLPIGAIDSTAEREITQVALPGGGITGGEITLGDSDANNLALHTGDWVMLKGPADPSFGQHRYRWYRVLDTEIEPRLVSGTYVRDATLFGSDWALPQAETQAVLVTGVSAVYERTVRIQKSSLWP